MKKRVYPLICLKAKKGGFPYLRMSDLAIRCQVHPGLIDHFVSLGLVDPHARDQQAGEWLFDGEAVKIIEKILRLRNDLGINYSGIGVVLDLLGRIEELEARIRELEKQV
ncbi:MAG: MerR family transcriptional regulator [Desulfobacterales bacterium]|nr:MAG: MerR family transcriptional regulator [Desulfobacterales bacterium]